MFDALKTFLSHELTELQRNDFRVLLIVACFLAAVVLWFIDNSTGGEEIALNEPPVTAPTPAPPATQDLPVKPLPVTKSPEGVTPILGADASPLTVVNPFASEDKPKPPSKSPPPTPPPIIIQPPQPTPQPPAPREKILLMGTAISGNVKTAMFLRGKKTIFLTIGDELDGRRIVDITPDLVLFADGARVYLQKEMP